MIYSWAYQYRIIQYYPKQSLTDEEGKPFVKMQKTKALHEKANFRELLENTYKTKLVLKKKNMKNHMQSSKGQESERAILELEERCGANIPFELHEWIEKPCLFSPAAACPGCAERFFLCRQKINTNFCRCANHLPLCRSFAWKSFPWFVHLRAWVLSDPDCNLFEWVGNSHHSEIVWSYMLSWCWWSRYIDLINRVYLTSITWIWLRKFDTSYI